MSEQDLREEIVRIVEELYEARLITPTGGNVSVRLSDEEDAYLITPTRLHKGSLRPEDIVRVNGEGKPANRRQRPSVETKMHLAIYKAYPDIEAVIHSHAPYATALGLIEGRVLPISVDAVPFIEMRTVPFGLPGDETLIANVVKALEHAPAVLLQNHGLLTVGWTLRQAANRALALEEVIQILVTCRLLGGEPKTLPEETVELLRQTGAL
ncbi:MAG TPA: class II aldolase/adducin family protein [Chloroflexi bacterium]|nr:class II aldolase/adducin family protein [Chloroflexota bacterium]